MLSVKLNSNSAGSKICQLQKGFDQLFWNYDFRAGFCIGINAVSKLCALAAVCRMNLRLLSDPGHLFPDKRYFLGMASDILPEQLFLQPFDIVWTAYGKQTGKRGKPVRKEGRRGERE